MAASRQKLIVRFLMFVVRNVIVLSVVAGVFLMAFFIAMDLANIHVLVRDGMEMRTEYVFSQNNAQVAENMGKYFTKEYIANGELKLRERYSDYSIDANKYLFKVSIDSVWCWPWQTSTVATVKNSVTNIQGSLLADRVASSASDNTPPAWDNGKYKVYLKKINSVWRIERVDFIKAIDVSPRTSEPTDNIITMSPEPSATTSNVAPTIGPDGQAAQISAGGASVNLRAEPNTDAEVITKLPDGQEITVLEVLTGWYKVKFNQTTGYVSSSYVILR